MSTMTPKSTPTATGKPFALSRQDFSRFLLSDPVWKIQ